MGNMAYNREHTKTYLLRFNHKTDKDIIDKLDHVKNKMAYLKRLIRTDMASLAQNNAANPEQPEADPEQAADDSQK